MKTILKRNNRRRYIGFILETKNNKKINRSNLRKKIQDKCIDLYDKESKELGIDLLRYNGKQGIIKCDHIKKEKAINLLNSIHKISDKKVNIKTIGTSGTIKSLTKKHMTK